MGGILLVLGRWENLVEGMATDNISLILNKKISLAVRVRKRGLLMAGVF